jgi:hypothetical protein
VRFGLHDTGGRVPSTSDTLNDAFRTWARKV